MKKQSRFPLFLLTFVLGSALATPICLAQELPQAVAVPEKSSPTTAKAPGTPVAVPEKGSPTTTKVPGTPVEKLNSKVRPLNVTIELSNTTNLTGTLVDVDVVLVKTAFGEASVPLAEIAGIRFPQGEDVSTSIVMLNGDSITGATDVKQVTIDTEWGQALVNGSAIRSILFIPNLQWAPLTGISGKRWTLQEAKASQNNPNTPGSNNQASANANRGSVPGQTSNPSNVPGSQPSGTPSVLPGSSPSFGFPIIRGN